MRLGCRCLSMLLLLTLLSTTRSSEAAPIDLTQVSGANGLTTYTSTTLLDGVKVTATSLVGTLTFDADDGLGILDDEVTAATEILTVALSSSVSVRGIAPPVKVKRKVPEPGTLLLSGLGLGYCAWMARRHRRRQSSQA